MQQKDITKRQKELLEIIYKFIETIGYPPSFDEMKEKYKKGDEIKGKVTKFNPFGAFVEIEPKIQGLIHISEFGTKTKMEQKLKIGKSYQFQIIQIEPTEHRMTLRLAVK